VWTTCSLQEELYSWFLSAFSYCTDKESDTHTPPSLAPAGTASMCDRPPQLSDPFSRFRCFTPRGCPRRVFPLFPFGSPTLSPRNRRPSRCLLALLPCEICRRLLPFVSPCDSLQRHVAPLVLKVPEVHLFIFLPGAVMASMATDFCGPRKARISALIMIEKAQVGMRFACSMSSLLNAHSEGPFTYPSSPLSVTLLGLRLSRLRD